MTKTEDSFWLSLRESLLEMIFGRNHLESMRAANRARKECEEEFKRNRRAAEEQF